MLSQLTSEASRSGLAPDRRVPRLAPTESSPNLDKSSRVHLHSSSHHHLTEPRSSGLDWHLVHTVRWLFSFRLFDSELTAEQPS